MGSVSDESLLGFITATLRPKVQAKITKCHLSLYLGVWATCYMFAMICRPPT